MNPQRVSPTFFRFFLRFNFSKQSFRP